MKAMKGAMGMGMGKKKSPLGGIMGRAGKALHGVGHMIRDPNSGPMGFAVDGMTRAASIGGDMAMRGLKGIGQRLGMGGGQEEELGQLGRKEPMPMPMEGAMTGPPPGEMPGSMDPMGGDPMMGGYPIMPGTFGEEEDDIRTLRRRFAPKTMMSGDNRLPMMSGDNRLPNHGGY